MSRPIELKPSHWMDVKMWLDQLPANAELRIVETTDSFKGEIVTIRSLVAKNDIFILKSTREDIRK